MNAEIITIGDEILIGQIVDTNSAWMAQELNRIGVEVFRITSISDSANEIESAINEAFSRVDVVLVTGGLGPTSDDITKPTLARYFNTVLELHEPTLKHVEELFKRRGLPLTESNKAQAFLPASCTVIPNLQGTAPGMMFTKDKKVLVSMPGVPFEMKFIMGSHILPWLTGNGGLTDVILHKTIQTFGLPESFLSDRLAQWEQSLPPFLKLAYLPSPTSIRLRLTARGKSGKLLEAGIKKAALTLLDVIPNEVFGYNDASMADVVGVLLRLTRSSICTAESCTGGTIAQMLTSAPGASNYFMGSVVAYANSVKQDLLGVSITDIETHGAVSSEVVETMAKGALRVLGASYAIATSGIAGPGGGTNEKPVGTVWVAVASSNKVISQKFELGSDREKNIIRSSVSALNMLRLLLFEENPSLRETFFSKMFD
ncbi:MAG: competence/damage-inducible protein A [Bacteroidales bacterium]|nr:competence/damage-inducible protein A [Bacteroidales bacterium]MBN2750210.1 competence/damage-inducible protein A [Bacteroidales bacterium]